MTDVHDDKTPVANTGYWARIIAEQSAGRASARSDDENEIRRREWESAMSNDMTRTDGPLTRIGHWIGVFGFEWQSVAIIPNNMG